MAGNTTFFAKAAGQRITWRDIFSDVFKRHTREDGERLFAAGTVLSTPSEDQMLAQWRKPWLFAYVGLFGLGFLAVMYALLESGGSLTALVPLLFVGSLIVPLAVLLLMWEMNIPRNIPIYGVLGMFFVGGGLSLLFTLIMKAQVGLQPAYLAPITEEPAKLLALCLFLNKRKYRYTLNGMLIGAAVGAGFAAFESMGKSAEYGLANIVLRGVLAPGGHVAWAALYGGALALVKGSEKLRGKHFIDGRFLSRFGIAVGLHFLWNNDAILLMPLPFIPDLKFVLLIVAAWIALLPLIKQGVVQVMHLSPVRTDVTLPVMEAAYPATGALVLRGVSGALEGSAFPLTENALVLGRDAQRANVLFPSSARGISSVHCVIVFENGYIWLIDKGSTYGTFLADGTRLTPDEPVKLERRSRFYIATHENAFELA